MDEEHLENFKIDVIECGSKYKGKQEKRNFFYMFCMLFKNFHVSVTFYSIAERKARKMIAMKE